MTRPTKAEAILDGAATLFAKHGYERTSLKLIASTLDYTNAGLLHHYPSKQKLYDAVLAAYVEQVHLSLERVAHWPAGPERDRAFIDDAIDFAEQWPGLSDFGVRLLIEDYAGGAEFERLGLRLLVLVGIDLTAPDFERLLRVYGAMTAVNHNIRLVRKTGKLTELRGMIATVAMDMLGHPRPR